LVQAREVEIPAIHHVVRARRGHQMIQHVHIVQFSVGKSR
jgi:hypothetical protein